MNMIEEIDDDSLLHFSDDESVSEYEDHISDCDQSSNDSENSIPSSKRRSCSLLSKDGTVEWSSKPLKLQVCLYT